MSHRIGNTPPPLRLDHTAECPPPTAYCGFPERERAELPFIFLLSATLSRSHLEITNIKSFMKSRKCLDTLQFQVTAFLIYKGANEREIGITTTKEYIAYFNPLLIICNIMFIEFSQDHSRYY